MTPLNAAATTPTHKIDSRNAAKELTPAPPREGICVSLCMSSLPVSSLCYEMTLVDYTLYEMTLCEVALYEFTWCGFTLFELTLL